MSVGYETWITILHHYMLMYLSYTAGCADSFGVKRLTRKTSRHVVNVLFRGSWLTFNLLLTYLVGWLFFFKDAERFLIVVFNYDVRLSYFENSVLPNTYEKNASRKDTIQHVGIGKIHSDI